MQTNRSDWLSEKFHSLPASIGGFFKLKYLESFTSVSKCTKHIPDQLLLKNVTKTPSCFQDDDSKLLLQMNANKFV